MSAFEVLLEYLLSSYVVRGLLFRRPASSRLSRLTHIHSLSHFSLFPSLLSPPASAVSLNLSGLHLQHLPVIWLSDHVQCALMKEQKEALETGPLTGR